MLGISFVHSILVIHHPRRVNRSFKNGKGGYEGTCARSISSSQNEFSSMWAQHSLHVVLMPTIMEHLKPHERQVISNLCSRQVAGRCSSMQKGIHVKMYWQRALRTWIEKLFATCLKGSSYLMFERHILLNACSVVSSRGRPSTRGKIELVVFPQAYGINIFLPTLTIILKMQSCLQMEFIARG